MCVVFQLENQYKINPFVGQRAQNSLFVTYIYRKRGHTHTYSKATDKNSTKLRRDFWKPNVKITHSFLLFSPETVCFAFCMDGRSVDFPPHQCFSLIFFLCMFMCVFSFSFSRPGSCSVWLFTNVLPLTPIPLFPLDVVNAIMNMKTHYFISNSLIWVLVFGAPMLNTTRQTKSKTKQKRRRRKKRKENRLLQVNEHVFTVQLNVIPFFLFDVLVPPHAVCVFAFVLEPIFPPQNCSFLYTSTMS